MNVLLKNKTTKWEKIDITRRSEIIKAFKIEYPAKESFIEAKSRDAKSKKIRWLSLVKVYRALSWKSKIDDKRFRAGMKTHKLELAYLVYWWEDIKKELEEWKGLSKCDKDGILRIQWEEYATMNTIKSMFDIEYTSMQTKIKEYSLTHVEWINLTWNKRNFYSISSLKKEFEEKSIIPKASKDWYYYDELGKKYWSIWRLAKNLWKAPKTIDKFIKKNGIVPIEVYPISWIKRNFYPVSSIEKHANKLNLIPKCWEDWYYYDKQWVKYWPIWRIAKDLLKNDKIIKKLMIDNEISHIEWVSINWLKTDLYIYNEVQALINKIKSLPKSSEDWYYYDEQWVKHWTVSKISNLLWTTDYTIHKIINKNNVTKQECIIHKWKKGNFYQVSNVEEYFKEYNTLPKCWDDWYYHDSH